MHSDYRELLSALNGCNVKHLVVGAYAVGVYAQPRATKDLDILVKADVENARALFAALAKFRVPLQGLTFADLATPGPFFRMGHEPVGVDILTEIPGVDFDAAWEQWVEGVIDAKTGFKAFFISKDDLIAGKIASGRIRDLADVEDIRKAAESQRPEEPGTERA